MQNISAKTLKAACLKSPIDNHQMNLHLIHQMNIKDSG